MQDRRRPETLDYVLSTAATAPTTRARPRQLQVLGLAPDEPAVYVASTLVPGHIDRNDAPLSERLAHVARIALTGPYAGQCVPMASWYADGELVHLPTRFDALLARLDRLPPMALEQFALTTRVAQRRALRLGDDPPVRKYGLHVAIAAGVAEPARTTVTAYLRPRVTLEAAWMIPRRPLALVCLGFVGVASGAGVQEQTLVLVPRRLTASITVPMIAVVAA